MIHSIETSAGVPTLPKCTRCIFPSAVAEAGCTAASAVLRVVVIAVLPDAEKLANVLLLSEPGDGYARRHKDGLHKRNGRRVESATTSGRECHHLTNVPARRGN